MERLLILVRIFAVSMLTFIIGKPLFMLYNHASDPTVTLTDYADVVWHGLSLDMTVAGYILVIPWIIVCMPFGMKKPQRTDRKRTKGGKRSWLFYTLGAYLTVAGILTSLIFVADTVMYDFWHFKLDSSVFLYTDKPGDALASVSTLFVLLVSLSWLLLAAATVWAYIKILPRKTLKLAATPFAYAVLLPLGGVIFLMIRGGLGEGTANVSKAYYSDRQFLNHASVNPTFNMLYSLGKSKDFAGEFNTFSEEECDELTDGIYTTESEDTNNLLNTERPNIVMIVWEGCGASLVEILGGECNVTPNLCRIASEGVLFTNCYANSFRTDRGLVSIMSGWLGMPTASLMKIPEKCESLPGLPRALREAGYKTDFWYGGDITFTNMSGYMLQMGFQNTVSDKDFSAEDRSYSKWGVPDHILFEKATASLLSAERLHDAPFFTTILTLSSHEPWEVPYRRLNKKRQNSFAYTDECIGNFIDTLKASQLWQNTLVVILPDHGVMIEDTEKASDITVAHIPIVLTGGAVKKSSRINILMNQSDLAATLLGQLGVEHGQFTFSRDVLSDSYKYHTAVHTFINGVTFVDSTGYTTFDNTADEVIATSGQKESPETELRAKRGRAILQLLYKNVAER